MWIFADWHSVISYIYRWAFEMLNLGSKCFRVLWGSGWTFIKATVHKWFTLLVRNKNIADIYMLHIYVRDFTAERETDLSP